ncbi:MAG: hypothetical protein ACI9IO_002240, partial [Cyanobium sp.]
MQPAKQQKSHPWGWLFIGMKVLPGIELFSQGAAPQ